MVVMVVFRKKNGAKIQLMMRLQQSWMVERLCTFSVLDQAIPRF